MLYLFIEDARGRETFQTLARRIANIPAKPISFKGSGEILKPERVVGHIKAEQLSSSDKVVAVVDKDCQTGRLSQVRQIEQMVRQDFPRLRFRYVVAVEELESWLSADLEAVQQVSRSPRFTEAAPQAECHDPKAYLKRAYDRAGRHYIPAIENPKLADAIDLSKVASVNASFREFREAVLT